MLHTGRTRGMPRTRLCSRPAAGRHSAGSTCRPILMPVSAMALMIGAPSAAYAQQCWESFATSTGTANTAFLPSGSAFLSSEPDSAPNQQSGGAWTRAVGGTVSTVSPTNFNASFTVTVPGGQRFPVAVRQPCNSPVKQDFAGFEVGQDIALLNTANSEWHFGVLAGYVGVKIDSGPQAPVLPSGTAFSNTPSAGLYASFSKGALSADIQARVYDNQGDFLGTRLDFDGYSFAGNAGYRFDLPSTWTLLPGNWTLEPSVGGLFSRTSFTPIDVGALTFPISGTSLATLKGTIQVQDVDSLLGRASVKLGTSLTVPGTQLVAYPFVTASVFHEFEGNVTGMLTATGTSGPAQLQGGGTFTSPGVGTYGQFGGGSAFQLADTGWLGFVRVDYRTGDFIHGYSVSGGLRYQLEDLGHVAEKRAPYPVKAMKTGPAESYDWSGPYAGLSVGSTWGHTHWTTQGGTVDPDYAGYLLGGQAGFNFQRGQFVGGIEADAGASNARGTAACPNQPLLFNCEDNVGALGSVTARFGYSWGRALFYAKGGWAYGDVTAARTATFVEPGISLVGVDEVGRSTNWENGWTVGAGMEFALTDRWSAKAEFMHYEFPQYPFAVAQNATANASTAGDVVRIGVNYHFRP
jgi:opacity protein-like surface antigen